MQKRDHVGVDHLPEDFAISQGVKRLRLENETFIIQEEVRSVVSLPESVEDDQDLVVDVDYNTVNSFLRDLHNSRVIRKKTREAQTHADRKSVV